MSGYWVIVAPAAVAALAAVVVLSRRMAYRPRHNLTGLAPPPAPFTGSMILDDELGAHREAAGRGTWFPHPDPWPQSWPQADGWADGDLADLRAAPTVFDGLELPHYEPALGREIDNPADCAGYGEEDLVADLEEQGWFTPAVQDALREQLGEVDQLEPADRLANILGPLEPGPEGEGCTCGATEAAVTDPGALHFAWCGVVPCPEGREPYDVLLSAEVAEAVRALNTETGLYLADLADRARAYLLELRECL